MWLLKKDRTYIKYFGVISLLSIYWLETNLEPTNTYDYAALPHTNFKVRQGAN